MQRLFSTFANGLPGMGLLIQRFIAGSVLVGCAITHLRGTTELVLLVPQLVGLGTGLLLILGLWTPVAGVAIAVAELWALLLRPGNPWTPVLLAALGASLALIGPGAWSVDARLFGRKQISVPQR